VTVTSRDHDIKGQFHSLKSLHLAIKDKTGHKVTTYWVAVCMALHVFAMQCEDDKRSDDKSDAVMCDPFIVEGLLSDSSNSDNDIHRQYHPDGRTSLQIGKDCQQDLKDKLFHAKTKCAKCHL
jgi:hypothetical protein